jgi:ribose transport system ATP-binding protein
VSVQLVYNGGYVVKSGEMIENKNVESNESFLITKGISKEFNGVYVLKDINFDIKKGEVHSLVGENGAGKSTFIKILSGLYLPSKGVTYLNGSPVSFTNVKQSEEVGIRTVQQEINIVPFYNVYQSIFIGSEEVKKKFGIKYTDDRKMREMAKSVIKELGIDLNVDAPSYLLSVLEKKIIEISRALVRQAKILIFDEPTTSLGLKEINKLFEIIEVLKEKGLSILFVSHDIDEVMHISDRITVFRDGNKIGTFEKSNVTVNKIISSMIGHELKNKNNQKGSLLSDEIMLDVENLSTEKLKNISFKIRKGEILGIAGVVGAGKTELAKAIYGLEKIKSGKIIFRNSKYIPSPQRSIDSGIAFIPEERRTEGLILNYSVSENMTLAYLKRWCSFGIINNESEINITRQYINRLSIKTKGPRQAVDFLSGGNQQKVVIARWLSGDFYLGLFDEPTKGIDIKAKEDIYNLFVELAKQGKSILFLSSYLPELINLCDRILVMRNGEIVGEFRSEEENVANKIMSAVLSGGTLQ